MKGEEKHGRGGEPTFAEEVWYYIRHRKRWWMVPIILVLGLLSAVALLAGLAPSLPFIYTLF